VAEGDGAPPRPRQKDIVINTQAYGEPHSSDRDDREATAAAGPAGMDGLPPDSPSAARLLAMIARETDQWRADAQQDAATIVAGARHEAAAIVRAAREEAERLVAAAREESAHTVNEARVEAYRVREETTAARTAHDDDMAHLERMAAENRTQLRRQLTEMLDRVDAPPGNAVQ
jgi:cell division septum initiation protein DivIVA